MHTRVFSKFRATILSLTLAIIFAACGGNPGPVGPNTQPSLPSGASTQALRPTNIQRPPETKVPVETRADAATPTQAPGSLTSVCPLVTKEEAEAALGSPVKDPVEQNFPPVYSCKYNDTEGIYFLDVVVVEFSDAAQAEGVFQMTIDNNNYPLVSGLGDRAYSSDLYDITVDKGRYELSINVVSSEEKEARVEKAKALAKLALDRLP